MLAMQGEGGRGKEEGGRGKEGGTVNAVNCKIILK